jgi:hypothetical protein
MRISCFDNALAMGTAIALLSACGGAQPTAGPPAAMLQTRTSPGATHDRRGGSWMLPSAKRQSLLYVPSYYGYVNVYSYPKGKLVGSLTGFSYLAEDCSDKLGNVWIIDNQNNELYKYAHGGTVPIATLVPPSSDALSCAVNPRNGDLAVGVGTEALFVYRHAQGTPAQYRDYGVEGFVYCAYDPKGNLFISGLTPDYKFQFAELAKGAGSIANIALDQSIERPGGVVAMPDEVAVGDGAAGIIYEFRITSSGGTKVGTTPLAGVDEGLGQFLTRGRDVVAAVNPENAPAIDTFRWPAGGAPIGSISNALEEPEGVAISVAR